MIRITIRWILFLSLCQGALPAATVPLWVQPRLDTYQSIVDEVSSALARIGSKVLVCEDTSLIPRDASVAILIGLPDIVSRIVPLGDPNLKHPESYLVRAIPGTPYVVAAGGGERGLLYAAGELAERIAVFKEFPSIFPRQGRPFMEVRAFGIEWPGAAEAGQVYDTDPFPDRFTRHLVRNRFNLLVVTHSGRVRDLLENGGEDSRKSSGRFKRLAAFAQSRKLEVALWLNPDADLDTPLEQNDSPGERRNRWSTDVARLALQFPGVHLGLWPGDERRERSVGDANQWFDGFLQPWMALAPLDPLTALAGLGFSPQTYQSEMARHLQIPPLAGLKWCGDHPEACLEPQFTEQDWFRQDSQNYRLLWVLADRDVRCLRSAFYHRTRYIIQRMGKNPQGPVVAGFLFFPRGEELAVETLNRKGVENRIPWAWGFQKHWYRHALWGRLGYDPRLGIEDFGPFFVDGYGPQVADALIEEESSGEDLLWRISRFHWRYEGDDWYPEACLAPGEGGPYGILGNRTGPTYRDTGEFESPFESVLEFIFSLAADPRELSIIESVGYELAGVSRPLEPVRRLTPLETAEILRRQCARLEDIASRLEKLSQDSPRQFEARHAAADLVLQRYLGVYYRSKILAAHRLMMALCQNSEEHRQAALKEMEKGIAAWKTFTEKADRIYELPDNISGPFQNWSDLVAPAEKDLEMIQKHPFFTRNAYQQPIYGPFVKGSTELLNFEAAYVRRGDPLPPALNTVEVVSFSSRDAAEQGWLDILNHYAGFIPLGRIPEAASGEVAWVPVQIPPEVNDYLSLRLVGGTIDEVVWGGRTVLLSRPEERKSLETGNRLQGPEGARILWIRSDCPPVTEAQRRKDWGFAVAIEPDLPFLLEPAWWEADGLVVRIRNRLVQGRLDNIEFDVKPVGEGWTFPPQKPSPISLSDERSFLIPCRLEGTWAALKINAQWRREQVGLDFFPPDSASHLSLLPGAAGMIPRLVEGAGGWAISTALRGWQNSLLYRVNEAYLREKNLDSPIRKVVVEWYPMSSASRLTAEYRGIKSGEFMRSAQQAAASNAWIRTELQLPDMLEALGGGEPVSIRLFQNDHQDLMVREVILE